jgi:hypothetical protein
MDSDPIKEHSKDNIAESLKKQEAHLRSVIRHIESVQENCRILAERIIALGGEDNFKFAVQLIANSYVHDNSKLTSSLEFHNLYKDAQYFKLALEEHQTRNKHHPEAHVGGIKAMGDVHIAEMICDWKTRSSEAGTDLKQWIKETAMEKYGFTDNSAVYKKIKHYINLLLDKPMEAVK